MILLSLAGQRLACVIRSIFPPVRSKRSPLNVEPLEVRVVPAQYAVRMLSPTEGEVGTAGATFSGGLSVQGNLGIDPAANGAVFVDAPDALTALKTALNGSVGVTYMDQPQRTRRA